MHPQTNYLVAVARQQELLAQAERQRVVRQARAEAKAARRAERAERTSRRPVRLALRPRAGEQ